MKKRERIKLEDFIANRLERVLSLLNTGDSEDRQGRESGNEGMGNGRF